MSENTIDQTKTIPSPVINLDFYKEQYHDEITCFFNEFISVLNQQHSKEWPNSQQLIFRNGFSDSKQFDKDRYLFVSNFSDQVDSVVGYILKTDYSLSVLEVTTLWPNNDIPDVVSYKLNNKHTNFDDNHKRLEKNTEAWKRNVRKIATRFYSYFTYEVKYNNELDFTKL